LLPDCERHPSTVFGVPLAVCEVVVLCVVVLCVEVDGVCEPVVLCEDVDGVCEPVVLCEEELDGHCDPLCDPLCELPVVELS
jgi:hypothetical protein